MESLLSQGHSCEMVYVVQREDCRFFQPADDIDKKYGDLLRAAVQKGLKVSVFPCALSSQSVELRTDCPLTVRL